MTDPAASRPETPAKPRIMILEDSALVAMALEDLCAQLGWIVAELAVSIDDGMRAARTATLDAALLDANIGDAMSWDVAAALQERRIPFAFATGHDLAGMLPAALAQAPVLRKPFRMADAERVMRQLLAAG